MKNTSIANFYNTIASKKIKHKQKYLVHSLIEKTNYFSSDRNQVIYKLIQPGKRYLDIGVGDGWLIQQARNKFPELYGIDISLVRIKYLKKNKQYQNIKLSSQNIEEKTTFHNSFFDAISMVAVLEHVFDPHRALIEVSRILTSGGMLYIEVPNIAWVYPRLSLLFGKFPVTSTDLGFDGGHLHYFEIHNLRALLEEHGFIIISVTCSGFFSSLRQIFPSLLGGDLIVVAKKT